MSAFSSNVIESAHQMVSAGRPANANRALEHAGRAGDPAAYRELALWRLQGFAGPRDLKQSRAFFAAAGGLGDKQAQMIHLSFVAQGVGGVASWAQAMLLLQNAAKNDLNAAHDLDLIAAMRLDEDGGPLDLPSPQILSERPDARLFPSLLSATEAEALIARAGPILRPSVVVDPRTGQLVPNPVRTSDNCSFPYVSETPFINALNRRIAAASGSAVEAGEPLQVLRYKPRQEYKPHFDAIPGTDNQRVQTALIYLNEGYSGGETRFVTAGLNIAGEVGDALLFRNVDHSGKADPASQHAGLPVTRGEKFLASRWIRQRPFGPR